MARTPKDTVDYFPHDANASSSDTMTILQSRFGNDGYAFWFKLLEKLASSEGHYIDCRNPTKWQLFMAKMGVNEITTVEIMNLLVEMQAIDKELWESRLIWCDNLVKNVADVYKNRKREIPRKPIIDGSNVITTSSNGINTSKQPIEMLQSKVKYSKVNNIKVDNNMKENKNGTGEIFEFYENNFELIKPFVAQRINDFIKEYGNEKVKDAMEIAINNNARKLSYVESVLENRVKNKKEKVQEAPEWITEGLEDDTTIQN